MPPCDMRSSIRCSASWPSGAPVRNAFCQRKRKIGGLGNFGAPCSPPCSGSFCRSSAAATASRCTGVGRSPGLAADMRGERLAQRGGVLRHHLVVGAVCLRHALQHLAERRPSPARLRREIRAAPERRAVRGDEHGQRPAALLAQRMQRRHVEVVDVRPLLAVHLDVDEPLVHQRRGVRILERLVRHHMAPVAGGVADRQQDRFVLRSRLLQRRRPPRAPVHRIVRVLQQIRRGLVAEQVFRRGHGVALLGCRDDIGRHGRRHHLCRRLGCRTGGDRGDAAERAGQPHDIGGAVRPRSAAATRLVPPAARRRGHRTRPGHGGVAARSRELHRRGFRGVLPARRPCGADGRRRCAGGTRRQTGGTGRVHPPRLPQRPHGPHRGRGGARPDRRRDRGAAAAGAAAARWRAGHAVSRLGGAAAPAAGAAGGADRLPGRGPAAGGRGAGAGRTRGHRRGRIGRYAHRLLRPTGRTVPGPTSACTPNTTPCPAIARTRPDEAPRAGTSPHAAGHTDPHSGLGTGTLAGLLAGKPAMERHGITGSCASPASPPRRCAAPSRCMPPRAITTASPG